MSLSQASQSGCLLCSPKKLFIVDKRSLENCHIHLQGVMSENRVLYTQCINVKHSIEIVVIYYGICLLPFVAIKLNTIRYN